MVSSILAVITMIGIISTVLVAISFIASIIKKTSSFIATLIEKDK